MLPFSGGIENYPCFIILKDRKKIQRIQQIISKHLSSLPSLFCYLWTIKYVTRNADFDVPLFPKFQTTVNIFNGIYVLESPFLANEHISLVLIIFRDYLISKKKISSVHTSLP